LREKIFNLIILVLGGGAGQTLIFAQDANLATGGNESRSRSSKSHSSGQLVYQIKKGKSESLNHQNEIRKKEIETFTIIKNYYI